MAAIQQQFGSVFQRYQSKQIQALRHFTSETFSSRHATVKHTVPCSNNDGKSFAATVLLLCPRSTPTLPLDVSVLSSSFQHCIERWVQMMYDVAVKFSTFEAKKPHVAPFTLAFFHYAAWKRIWRAVGLWLGVWLLARSGGRHGC